MSDVRQYAASARTTDVFGRIRCNARHHEFLIDGPVQNGCPGEELTPPEAFLAGIAACAAELIQVFARQQGYDPVTVAAAMTATLDRGNPVRTDCTVFNSARLTIDIGGVSRAIAFELAEAFKKR